MKKVLSIIIFIIVVLLVAGGAYYFGFKQGEEMGRMTARVTAGEAVSNPMGKMPSTNPFESLINPFKEIYKNPFR